MLYMNPCLCRLTLILPVMQIVSVVVLVTSVLFWHFYRYLSRQCESLHHRDAARGEPLPPAEQSVHEAHADNNGMVENKDFDEGNSNQVPSRDSEAETTRLIGHV